MKNFLRIPCFFLFILITSLVNAQCPPGYSTAALNWDYLDFLDPSFGQNTLTLCQNQNFAFGTQSVAVTTNFATGKIVGENSTVSAKAGTYSSIGHDVQFIGDGTITFSFEEPVLNIKFSIYDIDYNQKIAITALSGVSPALVSVTKVSGSVLSILPAIQPSTTCSATAAATTSVATSSTDGAINIDIAGPITSFTIIASQTNVKTNGSPSSQEDGSFWLSDIAGCSSGSFTTNYRNLSTPWPAMPSYVLTAYNNKVYYVDPATGIAKFVFQDAGTSNINSLAYDPLNHFIYYGYSLTGSPANDKALRRYDYNQDTSGIVMNDIGTLGIPIYDNGVESGGASFYDGSLYLGIEGNGSGSTSTNNRQSKIWKIDFNNNNIPIKASQVYGIIGYDHDWGDFGVADGILYDFDADAGNENLYVVPLISRTVTIATSPAAPKQTAIDWQENLFNIGNTGANPSTGFIASYTATGVQGPQKIITVNGIAQSGSWGDAGEAFKPKLDFGDAPSTYDLAAPAPAIHELDTALKLGSNMDNEWISRGQTILANSDNYDDGLPAVDIFNPVSNSYLTSVSIYNNTGSSATICAWLDHDGNGVFDISEGISVPVPSSGFIQSISLYWPSITSTLSTGTYTYLRIRISSSSNGMTTSNPTGYFNNGEVEDYRVPVNSISLNVQLLSFGVQKTADQKILLEWQLLHEQPTTKYEIQRSSDVKNWTSISLVTNNSTNTKHCYIDAYPLFGNSFYRLKIHDLDGSVVYSQIKEVVLSDELYMSLMPNPAYGITKLGVSSALNSSARIRILNAAGFLVYSEEVQIKKGQNLITLGFVDKLMSGIFYVRLETTNRVYTEKLIVKK